MTMLTRERPKERGKITACPHIDKPFYAKGMCRTCYTMKRYWSDPVFREKKKAYGRKAALKWIKKKIKQDPEWNAKRQRVFRKNHPDSFNYLMAKAYMKKLSPEKKAELIKEIA